MWTYLDVKLVFETQIPYTIKAILMVPREALSWHNNFI